MFDVTYIYILDREKSREFGLVGRCVSAGVKKIKAPGSFYAISTDSGQTWGTKRENLVDVKRRLRQVIHKNPSKRIILGRFEANTDKPVQKVKFATLQHVPPVASTPGVTGIDRIVGWIEDEVSEGRLTSRRYAGICVCKTTSSGGHSDHADCAAIDIFATWADMERIVKQVCQEYGWFNTKYAILGDVIYHAGEGSSHYSGQYHWHVHVSVYGGVRDSAC